MDSSARRVKAERNRKRMPRRSTAARWTRRVTGVLGTAALLGVAAVSAQMILPDSGDNGIEAAPAATATATPKAKGKAKAKAAKAKTAAKAKAKPLTRAQKAARADAVAEIRRQGFTTLKPSDYDPRARFRVLIGRPVGDAAGGSRAFFFTRDGFLGKDALEPSSRLRVVKTGKTTVVLSYGVYRPGDAAGAPSGRQRVRFRLEAAGIHALDPIPLQTARFQRRTG